MGNELAEQKAELSNSEKFTNKVLKEFGHVSAENFRISDYQRQLIQGYFIQIDRALKMAEEKRVSDNEWKRTKNDDPINWGTVDLNALALDVMHYARMGLDMMQKNMLFAIPYKDNSRTAATGTKMYTVNLMQGYNGIQYIAEKYAMQAPAAVTVELVYDSDTFIPVKKGNGSKVEGYTFEVNKPFDRGKIIGGFGYIEYEDMSKNRLVLMSKKDIDKRIPKTASANFWGTGATGKKVTEYVDGKKEQVETEGWYEEMCLKTIKREVYSPKNMPIDPKKIDDSYQYMKMQELRLAQMQIADIADEQTASIPVDVQTAEIEEKHAVPETDIKNEKEKEPVPAQMAEEADGQMAMPGF